MPNDKCYQAFWINEDLQIIPCEWFEEPRSKGNILWCKCTPPKWEGWKENKRPPRPSTDADNAGQALMAWGYYSQPVALCSESRKQGETPHNKQSL